MCLAIPARVLGPSGDLAHQTRVDIAGVVRTIDASLVEGDGQPLGAGEWVLIHVGFAIARIDETEARATLALLGDPGGGLDDELAAWREGPGQ